MADYKFTVGSRILDPSTAPFTPTGAITAIWPGRIAAILWDGGAIGTRALDVLQAEPAAPTPLSQRFSTHSQVSRKEKRK